MGTLVGPLSRFVCWARPGRWRLFWVLGQHRQGSWSARESPVAECWFGEGLPRCRSHLPIQGVERRPGLAHSLWLGTETVARDDTPMPWLRAWWCTVLSLVSVFARSGPLWCGAKCSAFYSFGLRGKDQGDKKGGNGLGILALVFCVLWDVSELGRVQS